jgi:[glutamine synthetase] adenylyltransferase / [glutamine synthetase]-adenylyl-L-tyrosine phosphorylase
MSADVEARIAAALARSVFADRTAAVAALVAEAPDGAAAIAALPDAALAGLARASAANPEHARVVTRRRGFLARAGELDAGAADRHAAALEADREEPGADLEQLLDTIRLLRREEMFLAACADFGGLAPFESVSRWLSALAEAIVRRVLRAALRTLRGPEPEIAVVAMGKLGGREFTYHSDLDLIFLSESGVEAVHAASRVAQRMISYVTTKTGAGSAYSVDSRLRPSGNQGMLVTSFEGFASYQLADAQTWEYLALVRARTLAGSAASCDAVLARVQDRVFGTGGGRWAEVADMRRRVEKERAASAARSIELKCGAGGLMDVEFLAEGAVLELGRAREAVPIPSVPGLLHHWAGAAAEPTLAHYRFLRRVEGRMRWCAGRAIESCERTDPRLPDVAELVEPGLGAAELVSRIDAARGAVRGTFDATIEAGTIRGLR